jgi:hypothetical protein
MESERRAQAAAKEKERNRLEAEKKRLETERAAHVKDLAKRRAAWRARCVGIYFAYALPRLSILMVEALLRMDLEYCPSLA